MAVIGNREHLEHWRRSDCTGCRKVEPEIVFWGYAEGEACIVLCPNFARKLLEDLCEFTPGGRHG
jgi:hypothetical protein